MAGRAPRLSLASFEPTFFKKMGKFDPHYSLRTAFDFFCRFANSNNRSRFVDRLLVDFDIGTFFMERQYTSSSKPCRLFLTILESNLHYGGLLQILGQSLSKSYGKL